MNKDKNKGNEGINLAIAISRIAVQTADAAVFLNESSKLLLSETSCTGVYYLKATDTDSYDFITFGDIPDQDKETLLSGIKSLAIREKLTLVKPEPFEKSIVQYFVQDLTADNTSHLFTGICFPKGENHALEEMSLLLTGIGFHYSHLEHSQNPEIEKKLLSQLALTDDLIADKLHESLTIYDKNGLVLFANERSAMLFTGKKDVSFIIGYHLNDFLDAADENNLIKKCARVIEEKKTLRQEMRLKLKNSEKWILNSLQPIVYQGQNVVLSLSVDISEEHKVREQARQHTESFKNMVDSLRDSVFILQHNVIQYVNKALCELSGYTKEELIGKGFERFIHPEERPKVLEYYKARITGKNVPEQYESIAQAKNGDKLHVEVTIIPVYYDGKAAFQVVMSDVTDYKKAVDDLRLSNEKSEFLVKSTFEGIVVHKKGFVVDVNDSFLKMTGYSREEAIGKNLLSYLSLSDKAKVLKNIVKPKAKPYNVQARRKDGSSFIAELEAKNVKHMGQTVRIVALRDVTERKRLQQKILESEERFKNLLTNLPGMAYTCELAEDYKMKFVSEGCYELTAYRPSDLIDNKAISYNDLIHPDDRGRIWQEIQIAVNAYDYFELEYRIITAHGEEKWVWEKGRKINKDGQEYLEGFIADISERKNAELRVSQALNELKQAQKLGKIGSYTIDLKNNRVYGSEQTRLIYGFDKDTVLSPADVQNIHLAEYRAQLEAAMQNLINHQKSYEQYFRLRNLKTDKILDVHSIAVFDQEQAIIRGVIQDITEQKQSEQEIQKFKTISDNALYGSAIATTDGIVVYMNDYFANIHGYKKEEIIGKHLSVFHNDEQLNRVNEIITESFEKGFIESVEVDHVHKNGEVIPMMMSIMIVHDEQSNAAFVATTSFDMREMKKTQQNLIKSEEKYRTLFDGIADAAFVHPFKNEGYGNFLEVNDIACERYGYTREEFLQKGPMDMSPDEDTLKHGTLEGRKNLFDNKYSVLETTHKTKDGKIIPVEISSRLFEIEGKPMVISLARDVSERKKAEKEIIESEARFRSIFENKGAATAILDPSGKVIMANDKCIELSKYSREELLTKSWMDLTHPDDLEQSLQYQESRKSDPNKVPSSYEIRFINKFGNINHVLLNVGILANTEYRVVSLMDITERIKTEEQLRISEERFRKYLQFAPYGVFDLTRDGSVKGVNLAACEMSGKTEAELKSQAFYDLCLPEERDRLREVCAEMIDGTKTLSDEFIFVPGEEKRVNWHLRGVKIDDETYLVFAQDITSRIRDEERLKELLHDQQIILDNDPTFIIFKDTGNNILRITKSVAQMTGIPKEKMEGVHSSLIYPEMADKYYEDDLEVIRSGKPKMGIVEPLYSVDGDVKWLLTNKIPYFDENGKIVGIILFSTDITKLKKFEDELVEKNKQLVKEKEKAEEADRLKTAFLANMSHEIRTPMNGIIGFTNLLKEPDLTGEEQEEFIEIIQKSGQRMLSTINDIVDISKIESGLEKVQKDEVDPLELIREQYDFFRQEALARNIKLEYAAGMLPDGFRMITDSGKLNSVLINLIKNALKFTHEGSIKIGLDVIGKQVRFYVADTGIGIPEDRQEAVFDRFVQADIADTRVYEGSGLGLAICKSYLEMQGGKIWLESEVGKGTVVYFSLPLTENPSAIEQEKKVEKVEKSEVQLNKLRILVAEDDEVSRELIKFSLSTLVAELKFAVNGEEVLQVFQEDPWFDLILMDIKMPKMNGLEATRRIRAFDQNIPIIAQTAYAQIGDKEEALAAGCNAYISKPIELASLKQMIKSIF